LVRHHAGGLIAFGVGLVLTSGSLWLLHQTMAEPGRWLEISVLVIANAVATLVRFLALRQLMSHHPRRSDPIRDWRELAPGRRALRVGHLARPQWTGVAPGAADHPDPSDG
jgi:hypothetical protein